ncbi:MAG: DUF2017 family protein, partial [Candidatus Binatia bacterium]
ELDEFETDVLRRLTTELREVIGGRASEPDDPVAKRLFPAAYEDPADEAVYRDLVTDSLEREKLEALASVAAALPDGAGAVRLGPQELEPWLASLTDLRLAIGTRLDVDEDVMSSPVDPQHPDASSLVVLHWLGYVQEGILRTVDRAAAGPMGDA